MGKIHLQKASNPSGVACKQRFTTITAQNYDVRPLESFLNILLSQGEDICCKQCAAIARTTPKRTAYDVLIEETELRLKGLRQKEAQANRAPNTTAMMFYAGQLKHELANLKSLKAQRANMRLRDWFKPGSSTPFTVDQLLDALRDAYGSDLDAEALKQGTIDRAPEGATFSPGRTLNLYRGEEFWHLRFVCYLGAEEYELKWISEQLHEVQYVLDAIAGLIP